MLNLLLLPRQYPYNIFVTLSVYNSSVIILQKARKMLIFDNNIGNCGSVPKADNCTSPTPRLLIHPFFFYHVSEHLEQKKI